MQRLPKFIADQPLAVLQLSCMLHVHSVVTTPTVSVLMFYRLLWSRLLLLFACCCLLQLVSACQGGCRLKHLTYSPQRHIASTVCQTSALEVLSTFASHAVAKSVGMRRHTCMLGLLVFRVTLLCPDSSAALRAENFQAEEGCHCCPDCKRLTESCCLWRHLPSHRQSAYPMCSICVLQHAVQSLPACKVPKAAKQNPAAYCVNAGGLPGCQEG